MHDGGHGAEGGLPIGRLIYSSIASLDGYVADENGRFDWAEPDDEVHAFVNELERSVGTSLLGRRMYEVLLAWETLETAGQPPVIRDYAEIWRAADKVVYSSTLETVSSARTRLERTFEPDAVAAMKATTGRDLSVGGPGLAARALETGLVDVCRLFVVPIVVGGGTRCFPEHLRMGLELSDERRFANGTVYLDYRTV